MSVNQNKKNHPLNFGLLAHVDAGKTTLAEALLYTTGRLRKLGRVDRGDTTMDSHILEKERGITIFSSQAVFEFGNLHGTLLDTPGHVDFSAETERTLQILDYAILVISGTDGVQAHTRTLWRLLSLYQVPVFVFITKMDFARKSKSELLGELSREFGDNFFDFTDLNDEVLENISLCDEALLETFIKTGTVNISEISRLISGRFVFPCYFGSGLKLEGIEEFLSGLELYTETKEYPEVFGAKVFKITHDNQGNRLTHVKITGGSLKVRDSIRLGEREEKVSQLRVFSGAKFNAVDEVSAGGVCAVLGLSSTKNGQGLGYESSSAEPFLEPVMNYRIVLPKGCDAKTMLPKLRLLEEEDPLLRITWHEHQQEIHVGLMGEIQTEILKSLIFERFNTEVEIDSGRVLYKETITDIVEGVGHYEPLRHYSEVHLILEPLPRGSGLVFASKCSEDLLDRNWQRLIMTHLTEKQHLGVLTGSPITDIKITLAAGRAHNKHTEGGDFRQSTYRAVRHALMQANSQLLEPYYSFKLEVPPEQIGRAINDIRMKNGTFDSPEELGTLTLLRGRAPVTALNDYAKDVAAYTSGRGRLYLQVDGYDICHNTEQVIEEFAYNAESDVENTPDSVFCAHGGGFTVKWNRVTEYMHLESCLKKDIEPEYVPRINRRNLSIDDKELEAIMEREFGPIKRRQYTAPIINAAQNNADIYANISRTKWYIVDGYNVIFAWDELSSLAEIDLDAARSQLMNILCNYSTFTKHKVILVFDAYKVDGGIGKRFDYNGINIVYTKENETADMYIEKIVSDIGKNELVRVVTSDGLIQLSTFRSGVLRMPAGEFKSEVQSVTGEMRRIISNTQKPGLGSIGENISARSKDDE